MGRGARPAGSLGRGPALVSPTRTVRRLQTSYTPCYATLVTGVPMTLPMTYKFAILLMLAPACHGKGRDSDAIDSDSPPTDSDTPLPCEDPDPCACYVAYDAGGNVYSSIAQGVVSVEDGEPLLVCPGVHMESVFIRGPGDYVIQGESPDSTAVDGSGRSSVFEAAPGVNLHLINLAVQNAGDHREGQGETVDFVDGFAIKGGSGDLTLDHVAVRDNDIGSNGVVSWAGPGAVVVLNGEITRNPGGMVLTDAATLQSVDADWHDPGPDDNEFFDVCTMHQCYWYGSHATFSCTSDGVCIDG
jgi:hypothetical protein